MTDRVRYILEHHFALKNQLDIIPRTIQRIVRRIANRAGITKPVSSQVLRHTYSISCIKNGISTRALMQFLIDLNKLR